MSLSPPLRYASVCTGIGGAELAFHPLGWDPIFMSEVEAFPRTLLKHRFPGVTLYGDFTKIRDHVAQVPRTVDVLVGGTPCQSFSVAGLRGGLDDSRGNLALEFLRLADHLRPDWVVWENVPGVLSSNRGRDFGSFLGGLGAIGYGWAYVTLDAQWFGLAQRRARVFVVGYLGDWRPPAAVLFEREGLQWNPAPRREAGERASRPVAGGSPTSSGYRNDADRADDLIGCMPASGGTARKHGHGWGQQEWESGYIQTVEAPDTAPSLTNSARGYQRVGEPRGQDPLIAYSIVPESGQGADLSATEIETAPAVASTTEGKQTDRGVRIVSFGSHDAGADATEDLAPTLRSGEYDASHANGGVPPAVAIPIQAHTLSRTGDAHTPNADAAGRVRLRDPGLGIGAEGEPAHTINASGPGAVAFKPSHYTRGKDGAPSEQAPPLSADADKGDQDPLVMTLAVRGRPGGHNLEVRDDGLANAVLTPNGGRAGIGVGAIAFAQNTRDEVRLQGDGDVSGALNAAEGVHQRTYLAFDTTQLTHPENRQNPQPGGPAPTLSKEGHPPSIAPAVAFNITPSQGNVDFNARPSERAQALQTNGNRVSARGGDVVMGGPDAGTQEADTAALVRSLREAVGEEAFALWGSRVLDPLQPAEVLRPDVLRAQHRGAAEDPRSKLGDGALPCPEGLPAGSLRGLWEAGQGRSPYRLRLAELVARELGATLQKLPHESPPGPSMAVRRLTPIECERLQGFPDNWTNIEYRGKPAADGPRYKALGNAFAVPVVAWIGRRIAMVEDELRRLEAQGVDRGPPG